jgi:hypothetical protein
MRVSNQHLILRGKTFYYRRRHPLDLTRQMNLGVDIVATLKTKDYAVAVKRAHEMDRHWEGVWRDLRDPEKTIVAQGRLGFGPSHEADL